MPTTPHFRGTLLWLTLLSAHVCAQQLTATAHTATATATIVPAPVGGFGVQDETFALSDALIRELRRGGYVLYLRHGLTQQGSTDSVGAGEWWKNCSTTERLDPSALAQTQALGIAWSRQQILFSEVLSSEFCRAADTGAFLGVAAPTRVPALNDRTAFVSQKLANGEQERGISNLLATAVPLGKNRLLIGHRLPNNTVHPALSTLTEGHTAIFKPVGGARFSYVTTLSPGQWQWLGRQIFSEPPAPIVATAQVIQPPAPLINPAKEIKGLTLIEAIRKGGHALYVRHALSNMGSDQDLSKVPRWWENCAIQRNINDAGKAQARKVGAALRALEIPVSEVKVSQFCRARDTGHAMGLGPLEVTEGLNHVIGQRVGTDVNALRFALLASVPPNGRNVVLVSHTHGSPRAEERIMGQIQEMEIIVYKPDGKGNAEPIGRISVNDWDALMAQAGVPVPAAP